MNRKNMPPDQKLAEIVAYRDKYDDDFRRKARRAFSKFAPSARMIAHYDEITGHRGLITNTLASNGAARRLARDTFVSEAARTYDALDGNIMRFVTVFDSPWRMTLEQPEVFLYDMRRRLHGVLQETGCEGAAGAIEFQLGLDPLDKSLWVMPNAHLNAVFAPQLQPRKIETRINNGRRLIGMNGAAKLSLSDRLPYLADVHRTAAYTFKEPYAGKRFDPLTGKPRNSIWMMTPEVCLRLTEIHSYMNLSDLIIGFGNMEPVRRAVVGSLTGACRNG